MTATPPHHPTYNVRQILQQPHILYQTVPGKVPSLRNAEDVVLKVSGQFFGADKLQNKVACLQLLEKYCPSVPAPRVLAWFDGKSEVQVNRDSGSGEFNGLTENMPAKPEPSGELGLEGNAQHGWILLSRRPGRRLEPSDLEGETVERIMNELASFVANFRTKVPTPDRFGNITLPYPSATSADLRNQGELPSLGPRVDIKGLIFCQYVPDKPIHSALEYYQIKLQDQLTKLETEDVFTLKRAEVSPLVRRFMSNTLPALKSTNNNDPAQPTFTQYDFSPRNVLVSGSPRHVSGLLDFEFAGFFPPEEEFANDAVHNPGDWPAHAYEIFLSELESLGVQTPLRSFTAQRWTRARLLMKLIENIAPWFLREGGIKGGELEEESRKAAENVRKCIEELQSDRERSEKE